MRKAVAGKKVEVGRFLFVFGTADVLRSSVTWGRYNGNTRKADDEDNLDGRGRLGRWLICNDGYISFSRYHGMVCSNINSIERRPPHLI